METLVFLFFRRMRAPLLVLLGAYAISIGGLVLMPGFDDQGNPWRFDFFHAFYFVSYMGSTIGFGEIPYPFSAAQRFWVLLSIYLTVIAWLYAIGTILALIQDPAFRRAVTELRFTLQVRRLKSPFFLVVGYGDTGSLLVAALQRRDIQSVVIDIDPDRINSLSLNDFTFDIPGLCCDAREVRHLQEAGLENPRCIGVIALTDEEEINVKVAITSKLLRPSLKVIARAETKRTAANLASFDTDHIINPFQVFADHLAIALRTPSVHLLYKGLISIPGRPLPERIQPPRGTWIICGFGRFGQAVNRYLQYEGIATVVIEPDPEQAPEGAVIGRGTEAVTLREAGIDKAAGLVAGANRDINNLSIVMTAKTLNPDLYVVARQNRRSNDPVFEAAPVDLVMQSSRIIVWRLLPLLMTPLLGRFLRLLRHHDEEWAQAILDRLQPLCEGVTPLTWSIALDEEQAPAVEAALRHGERLELHHLLRDPLDRDHMLPALVLLLIRGKEERPLPDIEQPLEPGDQLLLCGPRETASSIEWGLYNPNVLGYLVSGIERPEGMILEWLGRRRGLPGA
jgi:voltage-gated potassium channel